MRSYTLPLDTTGGHGATSIIVYVNDNVVKVFTAPTSEINGANGDFLLPQRAANYLTTKWLRASDFPASGKFNFRIVQENAGYVYSDVTQAIDNGRCR